ncbi:hypothetical protein KFK09_023149 [Dendrobium nobile]|uniref:Uncharacterized protein n=1 Tax=Dendrobium nobile TaxID=94219 RepID=A0A8T3ARV3_DENNO|nr:hypothetical protein KFK09_023149 [Dendrobium nobile]
MHGFASFAGGVLVIAGCRSQLDESFDDFVDARYYVLVFGGISADGFVAVSEGEKENQQEKMVMEIH